ncbi:hypothetical protein ABK040_016558 [Willaertia magna]
MPLFHRTSSTDLKTANVDDWSKKEVLTWLDLIGLKEYAKDIVKKANITDGKKFKEQILNLDEQKLTNLLEETLPTFGDIRKLVLFNQQLKDNHYKYDSLMLKYELERQEKDQITSGKSSSFASKATEQIQHLKQIDVRSLTSLELVALVKNTLNNSSLFTKEHEQAFLYHNIDGIVFCSINAPKYYSENIFNKLTISGEKEQGELVDKLVDLSNKIVKDDYKYDNPILQKQGSITSNTSSNLLTSESFRQYPSLSHEEKIQIVIAKIRNSSKKVKAMSDSDLREYAENLSNVEGMKQAYLNREFSAIKKLFSTIPKRSSAFSSTSETLKAEDDLSALTQDIEEAEELSKSLGPKFRDTVKVKLVIAEIAKTKKEKTFRRLLSPIMSTIDAAPAFGMFHSALIVGPWLIEWNSSSLCIPRRCYSNAATLAIDIQEISTKDIDLSIDKVSQIITDWNVHHEYKQSTANCQHFVDDICRALGIKMNFNGSMQHYLNKLRNKGLCSIKWRVPLDIKEKVGLKETKISFNTHRELDTLMCNILSKIPNFQEAYEEDYMLLKSFDRAMWLRSFRNPQDVTYQAISKSEYLRLSGNEKDDDLGVFGGDDDDEGDDNSGTGCPFGHPEARSFTPDWW